MFTSRTPIVETEQTVPVIFIVLHVNGYCVEYVCNDLHQFTDETGISVPEGVIPHSLGNFDKTARSCY